MKCRVIYYLSHIYAQLPLINAHTDVPRVVRGLRIGLSLHLHREQRRDKRGCAYAQSMHVETIFNNTIYNNSLFNPFEPKGISHFYKLDQSISILRVVGLYFSFFVKILKEHSVSKQWRPWSASDLGLHSLRMPRKKDARLCDCLC